MRKRLMFITAGVAAAALALSGCSGGDAGTGSTDGASDGGALFEVASDVQLEGSPTYDAMVKADKVRIGVKEDQPGLGYLDAATGERSGFDVEMATWIAASLGFDADKIEFKAIPSANRESAIVNGDIDYYVGTYSITDKRKEQIDFAGPYFETGQGLLVAADNDDIKGEDDLAGKTVCSATGSTPIQNIKDNFPDTKTEEFDTYSQCVEALNDGKVDAVTTDQAILIGYAAQFPDDLKVVGEPFSTELYGIGLPKGDDALRHFINTMFTDGGDTWTKIYDATLGASGTKVTQPAVDDY
ncbi:glutamate ABC transporter substrate-binding protein [Plantibacter sp. PA-3-X8]|jgi:glutamate transport system substrate-binding protein|uniref:Amino acid ABC transporter substrate-binding protein, PAAT family n=2 Tax=Plantibacter TaxID=190323 RepID=A0ABY1LPZ9_9MICO|nr:MULTISPECIES: glutamate ABC transporter substrate-binding protein [Plantibacter]AZH84101.1 glutamate ABC transporter substrate-binding protein [Plantibacter sp. PA-3-X8]MBD8468113.1 glutamate ABC transporter substrate-binding protein [Plantibacter sp. CFBP 8798]MDD9154503.1 glutamate ABC transporter substrate-binding protein [Plantibacter flavus]SKC72418.1 amino acid ABC transporter substrate-binding protein, PAAT family [Plantibacter cousiniae]SMQ70349.1 amino acid ABC transporter substrat